MRFSVYELWNQDDGNIFYVGYTSRGAQLRFDEHIRHAKKTKNLQPRDLIILACLENDIPLGVNVISQCTSKKHALNEEIFWIAFYRQFNYELTNIGKGGNGGNRLGAKHSQATKDRLSAKNTGRKLSIETRKNMSKAFKGRKLSDQAKANMKAGAKNRKRPVYGN